MYTPLNPTFIYFVYLFFLFLLQNIDCGYSLGQTQAVLTCTHNQCFEQYIQNIIFFSSEIFNFYRLKNLHLLYGHFFVMSNPILTLNIFHFVDSTFKSINTLFEIKCSLSKIMMAK